MPGVDRLPPRDDRGHAAWDAYVLAHPAASFFHRAGWQGVLRDVFGHDTHFLYAHRGGRITGVLPLAHVRSLLFGHSLASLPFAVYGGVVADDDASRAVLEAEADRLARRLGVAHLELRHRQRLHADWPEQDLYVSFRRAILPDDEANLRAIPRKQRAMVRKGIANGLVAHLDEDTGRFFELYADNVRRHGTPALPARWFQRLRHEFGQDCEVLTVCSAGGEPLSSVLSFYFRDEVLPYYAGDTPAARELAANDFKYWSLMRLACGRGLKVFDYGRSKQGTGSYAFKRNWGFEPQALHYEYRLYKRDSVPRHNPANPRYRLLIGAWRRLPPALARRLGPLVVRSLG